MESAPGAHLAAVAQIGVGQDAGRHGLDNRNRPKPDTGIVSTLGAQVDFVTGFIERAPKGQD